LVERADKQRLFEQIVAENNRRLRIIARNNSPFDQRKDLEQEILLALWTSLDRFEGRSSLTTWFYRVAINTACAFNRRNLYRRMESATLVAEEPATYGNWQNRDPIQILEEFVQSLGELDRNVFLMYLDDVPYREMSQAVQIDEANLRVRVSRMKKQFESRYLRT
jgi:RNA polymerase sigma-70 factor (ECF subfamily)